jgi:acetyl-CoA carboxylase carboxyltransferase component
MPDDDHGSSKSRAASRLDQVQNHLGSKDSNNQNAPRRRRKQSQDNDLPADYSDILRQVEMLKKIAATPDPNNRGYQRQKKAGKLWVRERVKAFVDPGTFREVGSVSGTVKWRQIAEEREEPVECTQPFNSPCLALRR